MPFLRNTWYIAGWAHELKDKPIGLRLLDEPVLLYRTADGKAAAIGDRCPHRFAPLHLGKIKDGAIECPYHGLQFDKDGRCVRNPHGDGKIPAAARVAAYPLVERHNALWIWMGDGAKADPSQIVDITQMTSGHAFRTAYSYLHVNANYQLVTDNLLDLSHAPYLHPFLTGHGDYGNDLPEFEGGMKSEENTVFSYWLLRRSIPSPFFKAQWGEGHAPARCDMRAHMRWDPPTILQLDNGATLCGQPPESGPASPSVHLLTPETETTTHYFWCVSHDRQTDNAQMTDALKEGFQKAFSTEDEPMIAAVQDMMGTTDLLSLKPVLLPGDSAALRARRILQSLIEGEAST